MNPADTPTECAPADDATTHDSPADVAPVDAALHSARRDPVPLTFEPLSLEPAGAFGGFIGPRTLVSLVRVAAPWLFGESQPAVARGAEACEARAAPADGAHAARDTVAPVADGAHAVPDTVEPIAHGTGTRLSDLGAPPLGWWRILRAHARQPALLAAAERPDARQRTDYFALCLAAHWASVATYVPTDVDAKIRHALWFEDQPPEERSRMADLALGLVRWEIRGISARWVAAGDGRTISGHDGERLSVLCGGMLGLLAAGDAEGAARFEHEIDAELSREAAAFLACATEPGREIDLLRLATILTHNAGDVLQGLSAKSGRRVGAKQKDRYGDLARSGPALVGGVAVGAAGAAGASGGSAGGSGGITGRGRDKARYGGAFLKAGALYRALLASEGHRHYPLREARCLRRTPALMLPLGPFLDDWGAQLATHASLTLADRADCIAALVHGCKRVPGQQGYDRALAGFDVAHKGGVECEALTDLLPAALRRELASSERRRARAVRRASFESSLAKAARRILAAR